MRFALFSTLLAALCMQTAIFDPAPAGARRGWAIVGSSENISEISDIENPGSLGTLGFADPAIGFKYSDFSVFFVPLFTGGGSYVVFDRSADTYVPLDDAEVLTLSGRSVDELGTPFFYKVPFGWLILGPFLLLHAYEFAKRWRDVGA